jgi:hypothetical protein
MRAWRLRAEAIAETDATDRNDDARTSIAVDPRAAPAPSTNRSFDVKITATHTRIIAALAAAAAAGAADGHAAAGPPSAVCTNTFTATITPGLTSKPGAGKISTHGQTGSIECFGTIRGQRVTGPGTLGFVERHHGGTCRGHIGTGRVHLIIPTTAGSKDMVGTLSVRRTALSVHVTVRFRGVRYRGNGVIFPRLGDCASTPLEQVKVTMTGSLRDT